MIKKYFLFYLIFLAYNVGAQSLSLVDYIEYQNRYILSDDLDMRYQYNYAKSFSTNEILVSIFFTDNDSDTVELSIYNYRTKIMSTEKYFIQNIRQTVKDAYNVKFEDICFDSENIYLLSHYKTFILNRNSQKLEKVIDTKDYISLSGKLINTEEYIIAYHDHYSDYKHPEKTFSISLLDKQSFKTIRSTNLIFDFPQYTHTNPQHWIDYHGGLILFSNTIDYKIRIYDLEFNVVDSLVLPKEYPWKTLNASQRKRILKSRNSTQSMKRTNECISEIERISGAYWVSDTCILVNVQSTDGVSKYQYFFDVWKKREGKWEVDKFHLQEDRYFKNGTNNTKHTLFSYSMLRQYIVTEDNIFVIGFNTTIPLDKYTSDEYKKLSEEYLYDYNTKFQVIEMKHTFND